MLGMLFIHLGQPLHIRFDNATLTKQFVEVGPDFLLTPSATELLAASDRDEFHTLLRNPGYEAGNREGSEKLSVIINYGHGYCRNLRVPFSERYCVPEISDFLRADGRFRSKSAEDTAGGPFLQWKPCALNKMVLHRALRIDAIETDSVFPVTNIERRSFFIEVPQTLQHRYDYLRRKIS